MAESYQVDVYKCPNCASVVSYDPRTKKYVCESCGKQFAPERFRRKKAESLHGYTCSECGAELMSDEPTASISCPFCGNNEVAVSKFTGPFEPDFVIPFQIDLNTATARYEKFTADRKFLPDDYAERSRIVSAQGVYVPYWLFSGQINFDISYIVAVRDDYSSKSRKWYSRRAGTFEYKHIPADASTKMPNDMMDSITPYRFGQMEPFTTKFMPGFLAECYTESYEESWERVKDLLLQGTLREIGPSFGVPIETPRYDIFSTDPEKHLEQVLLPVWLFTISYGEEKYLVGVNGQTGSVAMNCSVDDGKRNELLSKKMRHSVFVSFLVSIPLAIAAAALAASVNSSPPSIFHFLILPLVVIVFACSVGAMLGAGNARQEITGNMEHVKSMQDIDRYMLKRSVSYSVEKDTEMSPLDPDKSLGTHTSIATGDIRIGEK